MEAKQLLGIIDNLICNLFHTQMFIIRMIVCFHQGLCGVFDGNATNDLLGNDGETYFVADPQDEPDTFSETYRSVQLF